MKKSILFVLVLLPIFHSCTTLEITKFPKEEVLYGIDFTKYSKNGFLITPEKYSGNYESIGLVEFVYMPEALLTNTYLNPSSTLEKTYSSNGRSWVFEQVDIQDAVEGIYKRCVEMGANAIINFKYSVEEKQYLMIKNPVIIKGYRLSGFAIKTK